MQHNRIILIETSTSLCSTALCEDGAIVSKRISDTPRSQASLTAPFIQEMLAERGLSARDCSAVCVSSGPGSYTGLRVGVSTAKGLCFGAGLPLVAVDTLETLAAQAFADGLVPDGCRYILPMIDARRMEVYTAVFRVDGNRAERISDIAPQIITEESFAQQRAEGKVLVIGDGAEKCREAFAGSDAEFVQCCPRADAMLAPMMERYEKGQFEDVAYFEPFYLKEFVATVSKKQIF